jgi:hypothetical protein
MVVGLNVRIVGASFSAKDAAYLVVLRVELARAVRTTHPPLQ